MKSSINDSIPSSSFPTIKKSGATILQCSHSRFRAISSFFLESFCRNFQTACKHSRSLQPRSRSLVLILVSTSSKSLVPVRIVIYLYSLKISVKWYRRRTELIRTSSPRSITWVKVNVKPNWVFSLCMIPKALVRYKPLPKFYSTRNHSSNYSSLDSQDAGLHFCHRLDICLSFLDAYISLH